jgi:hypothetical protein
LIKTPSDAGGGEFGSLTAKQELQGVAGFGLQPLFAAQKILSIHPIIQCEMLGESNQGSSKSHIVKGWGLIA